MRPYTPDDAARAAELDAREARPSAVDWTDIDLTGLVDAVTADVWAAQKGQPWENVDPATKHAAREAVLPFVTATVRHLRAALEGNR